MKKLLFICSQNRLRSPTAEVIFNQMDDIEALSAGTDPGADNPIDAELILWADTIFFMEKRHKNKISQKFKTQLKDKRLICLDIPDDYEYMDETLQRILKAKVIPLLR